MTPRALSIAGLDPSGGAGIVQDARTFEACGVWALTAVAAITVQDSTGVRSWRAVDPALLRAQVEAVSRDATPGATKTGMLGTAEHVALVAELCDELPLGPLVVDPVLRASSGDPLADHDVVAALRELLLPRAAVVTPNLAEATALTGVAASTVAEMRAAGEAIVACGARAALVCGGHLDGDDAIDVLVEADGATHELHAPRIVTADDHGTGCALSAAIAAHLALGAPLEDAVRAAKGVITRALSDAIRVGAGRGAVRPAARRHAWPLAGHPFE